MKKKYDSEKKCEKINVSCDKSQYGEIGLWERLKKQLHLFLCSSCRHYSRKNCQLTETIQKSELSSLNSHEIQALKQSLKQKTGE